jgi:glycosidase
MSAARLLLPACISCAFAAAATPSVVKVEPPNWWAGHSMNPVRLLVRGAGLNEAKVEAPRGITASSIRVSDSGAYLFVDLFISRDVRPGPAPLRITTPNGSAQIPFEISQPLPRAGRFQGFSPDDFIYLAMPDRFADGDPSNDDPKVSRGLYDRSKPRRYYGGDLQGIINHLPYLKDLGATALWINPVYDNANHLNRHELYDHQPVADYHGYGAVDFYAVDEHFGSVAKFRELVEAAHRLGLKVIQDQVANHTGPDHPWVAEPPTPTWFHGSARRHLANAWQTWTIMDPHSGVAMRRATLDGWFMDILPDLNQDDPEVARYLIQNSLWWVGMTGLDGIRQDTLPYVPRTFWRDWTSALHREYPNLRIVGEMFDGDASLVSFFQGGKARSDGVDSGIDALFDFPLFYAIRHAFAGRSPIRELAMALGRDPLYVNPAMLVTFLGLHDVPRFLNEPSATTAGLKLAFTFIATTRGIPMVYYGDEIAMTGGADPDNRRDFPGGFAGDARNAFTAEGRTGEAREVFDHVRRIARLRAASPCLRAGVLENLVVTDAVYVYTRSGGGCSAVVALNNSGTAEHVQAPAPAWAPNESVADALGGPAQLRAHEGVISLDLAPRSGAVFITR